jgi:carbamate kinase
MAANGDGNGAPLDVLGAETEGMVGHMLEQGLRAELPEREAATPLTQVIVELAAIRDAAVIVVGVGGGGIPVLRLPAGSMGPNAEPAARFVDSGGRLAAICSLDAAPAALEDNAGTLVREVARV